MIRSDRIRQKEDSKIMVLKIKYASRGWIPAFAGMTELA